MSTPRSSADPNAPGSLLECFGQMADPRVARTRDHRLVDVLVIGICTLLCGGEGFNDMEDFGHAKHEWLKTFLELPSGIPSHDTFNRVFCALNPTQFLDCFLRWTQSLRKAVNQEIVAMDGKALRRALNKGQGLPYIVSAWAVENGDVAANDEALDFGGQVMSVYTVKDGKRIWVITERDRSVTTVLLPDDY
jgi:hypothetical protein